MIFRNKCLYMYYYKLYNLYEYNLINIKNELIFSFYHKNLLLCSNFLKDFGLWDKLKLKIIKFILYYLVILFSDVVSVKLKPIFPYYYDFESLEWNLRQYFGVISVCICISLKVSFSFKYLHLWSLDYSNGIRTFKFKTMRKNFYFQISLYLTILRVTHNFFLNLKFLFS